MLKTPLEYRSPDTPARAESKLFGRNTIAFAIVVGVVLWLVIVFAYAPSAWATILYRLLADGGIVVLWVLSAAGLGAIVLRAFSVSEPDSLLLSFVTATGLGLGSFSLLILALGLAGWLNQVTAIALLVLGLMLGIAQLVRARWSPETLRARLAQPAGWSWAGLIVIPFAAVMTVGALLPPGLLWTPEEPHGYDVVEYHLQVPREWFEAGRILPLHHNVFSYFPFNVEMHYLLAMHLRGAPWSGMYLAQFMHGAFFVLAILAACGFANPPTPHKATRLAPIIAALAMATVPWIPQLGAIAYDEGGFILFGLLSIGWSLRAIRVPERRLRHFALAGAFAGLACGAKLTAVPEVLLAAPLAAVVVLTLRWGRAHSPAPGTPGEGWGGGLAKNPLPALPRSTGGGEEGRRVAHRTSHLVVGPFLYGLVGLLLFSPWLIRTAVWSHGNPVYPEMASVLGRGDFDDAQVQRWHNAHTARPDQTPLPALLHGGWIKAIANWAGWTEVIANWQFGYVLIPAALVSIILTFRQPETWFLSIVFLALTVVWLFFTHLQGRFFILAVPICALLVAKLRWGGFLVVVAQAVVGFGLLQEHFYPRVVPQALGTEDLSWAIPDAALKVPQDATLVLVGDERPFVYQRPVSLLVYRTVFDVKGDRGDLIEAFSGPKSPTGRQWLLISPDELQRFAKTYQPFPPVPPEIAAHQQPYLMER
jgi:hypothetical protein